MTKRALRRLPRESERHAPVYEDSKIRRLPLDRDWSPLDREEGRDQGYLKTIRPKSEGQVRMIEAIDQYNLVMALGPAGTGKTYLAIAKAVAR